MSDKIYTSELDKPELNEETLAHYGVLGMKWGVRKNPEKAWGKATKELAKRKRAAQVTTQKSLARASIKAAKVNKKLAKISKKYNRASRGLFANKSKAGELAIKRDKLISKAAKLNNAQAIASTNAAKAAKRSAKWEKQMKMAFGNTDYAKNFIYTNKEKAKLAKKKKPSK